MYNLTKYDCLSNWFFNYDIINYDTKSDYLRHYLRDVSLFCIKMDLHVHISGLYILYSEEKYSDENWIIDFSNINVTLTKTKITGAEEECFDKQ